MILFKPEHVAPILDGRKTETRRLWRRRRAVPGSLHQARTELYGPPFAHLRILDVRQERLGDIDDAGAIAEGYPYRNAYFRAFYRINGAHGTRGPDDWLQLPVWVVTFRCEPAEARQ